MPGMAKHSPLVSLDIDSTVGGAGDAGAAVLIQAPGAGLKIRVHSYVLSLTAAGVGKFRTGAGGTGTSKASVRASAAGNGQAESVERPDFLFECGANEALYLNLSAAMTATGRIGYSIVSATE